MDVKKIIRRHGFTINAVAERIGVTGGSLGNCIRRGSPTPTTLHRIADAIGADYSEFFEDDKPSCQQNIKEIIRSNGYTISQVAKMIGVSQGFLSSQIRQETLDPKILHKIADAIGVKYTELLLGHAPATSKRVLEVVMPDNAIDGGVVELGGNKYRIMFVPVEDSRFVMNCL